MMMLYQYLIFAAAAASSAVAVPTTLGDSRQIVLAPGDNGLAGVARPVGDRQAVRLSGNAAKPPSTRKLTGRFLHITDIHPDKHYKTYSSTDEADACHRGKGWAGYYGAESSDCDSPGTLVNATFDWLKKNLRHEVDFIIWTGDSARHDNDDKIPRHADEVVESNRLMVDKFLEAFGNRENWHDDDPTDDFLIPIIPTIGNNDITPHNVFTPGPNSWTNRYLDIWRRFIPEAQRHQFDQGGWFSVEVIPGKLAVISLNTLYFFSSNGAVDGCANKHQPGYEQFDWLRIQLDGFRERGIKVIIIGHVPPARVEAKTSWEETCWQKYTLWMHKYRDVVVGSLYGHMNIDHFMLQDYQDVKHHVRKGKQSYNEALGTTSLPDDFSVQSAQSYLQSLRSYFASIPALDLESAATNSMERRFEQIGGPLGQRYSMSLVSPSVVPNYFPTLRVISYNITGLDTTRVPASSFRPSSPWPAESPKTATEAAPEPPSWLELRSISFVPIIGSYASALKAHLTKRQKMIKFVVPKGPGKFTAPGPAYAPQAFTWTSFKQYYANLTLINHDFRHEHDIDDAGRWNPGKHKGKKPSTPKPHPLKLTFDVEYDTETDSIYALQDLTMRSVLGLATRLAEQHSKGCTAPELRKHRHNERNKTWLTFASRAFVGLFAPGEN